MFLLLYGIKQSNYAEQLKKTYKIKFVSIKFDKYQPEVLKTQPCPSENDKNAWHQHGVVTPITGGWRMHTVY